MGSHGGNIAMSNDIDGLLEKIDDGHAAHDTDEDGLQLEHRSEKKDKNEKKKKKERRGDDLEAGEVAFTPQISTYQIGAQQPGYGADMGGGPGNQSYGPIPTAGTSRYDGSGMEGTMDAGLPRREFSMCGPGTQDLTINMGLLLAFCAFEAVFSMISHSNLLLLDFYRRLGGVFAMVYTLEVVQASVHTEVVDGRTVAISALPDINASTSPAERLQKVENAAIDLRGTDRRRLYIASMMIGIYLLAVAFLSAMGAIISMYGGAPPDVEKSGWIMVIGGLCLVLDLVHVKFNVQVNLGTSAEEDANTLTKVLGASYGSLLLIFEAVLEMSIGGGYIDPILAMIGAGIFAAASSDSVMRNATALLYQSWNEVTM